MYKLGIYLCLIILMIFMTLLCLDLDGKWTNFDTGENFMLDIDQYQYPLIYKDQNGEKYKVYCFNNVIVAADKKGYYDRFNNTIKWDDKSHWINTDYNFQIRKLRFNKSGDYAAPGYKLSLSVQDDDVHGTLISSDFSETISGNLYSKAWQSETQEYKFNWDKHLKIFLNDKWVWFYPI